MAKLSADDVKKIANLIKIKISEEELQHYQDQLNTVLPSVDVLQKLDTSKVKETSQTHGLENVLAEDEAEEGLDINKYPNRNNLKNNYFVVKRVIND
jgi:aspartyl-tRNA(Asn)/glutamyl-tRNA(Gln) amidotransferase subunit C